MGSSFMLLKQLSKISYPLGLFGIVGAFILGWVGFSVPDWLSFQQVFSNEIKFGLWSYCTHSISTDASGFKCTSWSKANVETPDFLRTVQGLITIGMVFVTASAALAIAALILKKTLLVIIAAVTSFISFLFILVGIIVFAGDFDEYASGFAATNTWRRWGYWIFSAVIVLLIFAFVFLPFTLIFEKFIRQKLQLRENNKIRPFTTTASGTPNVINLVPSQSNPGYYREYSAPSPVIFSHPIIPPSYEYGGKPSWKIRTPKVTYKKGKSSIPLPKSKSKEPKAVIREIIEPVYYKDPPAYNRMENDIEGPYRNRPGLLPGESERNDEKAWDWEKIKK